MQRRAVCIVGRSASWWEPKISAMHCPVSMKAVVTWVCFVLTYFWYAASLAEGTCAFTPGNSKVLTMLKYISTKNYYKTTTTTTNLQRHSTGDEDAENKKGEGCMSLPKSVPLVIFLMPGEFADLAAKRDYLARLFGHNIDWKCGEKPLYLFCGPWIACLFSLILDWPPVAGDSSFRSLWT